MARDSPMLFGTRLKTDSAPDWKIIDGFSCLFEHKNDILPDGAGRPAIGMKRNESYVYNDSR